MVKPDHFEAANAVGAAIAQISGEVDRVYSLASMSRDDAVADAKAEATAKAIAAGADPATVQIVDVEDVPLAYLPGNATRIRVKAVGDLALSSALLNPESSIEEATMREISSPTTWTTSPAARRFSAPAAAAIPTLAS